MKWYRWMMVVGAAGFIAGGSANADDGNGGTASTRWTKTDVATYCHSRWGCDDRTHGYLTCLEHNKEKIGHDKSPADIQELDAEKATSCSQQ